MSQNSNSQQENGIVKISKLENFGIFKKFSWQNLIEFKQNNLIYGWNYSGKTTLSKLFQLLEFKTMERDNNAPSVLNAKFEIDYKENGNSKIVSENNIENFPFTVKVFNSEYISRIFTWDKPKTPIDAIPFYLGDEAKDINNKIKDLDDYNKKIKDKIDDLKQNKINDFRQYDDYKFTEQARIIREDYLQNALPTHKFNKSDFKIAVEYVVHDLDNYILGKARKDKTKATALSKNDYQPCNKDLKFFEGLNKIALEVKRILEDTAPVFLSIPELDGNKELFDWVQNGLEFHKSSNECKFCTSALPDNRISKLNDYYSEKLKEIQSDIVKASEEIDNEEEKLKIDFPHNKDIVEALQKDYETAIQAYTDMVEKYKAQLKILRKDLVRKSENFFNAISVSELEYVSLVMQIQAIENILEKHNSHIKKFDSEKRKAIGIMVDHYVANYLKTDNYIEKKKKHDIAQRAMGKIDSMITNKEDEKSKLERALKNIDTGRGKLNKNLQLLLNREDIKIEIENDKFVLKRSGNPAFNLSEGEKSAIAFSYFITELESLKDSGDIKKTIAFIDDPISSMDSNHIFQVRYILKRFFNEQNNYCQLFISTHNFEFLSILIDSRLFGKIEVNTKDEKKSLYFIQRSENGISEIKKLPKPFSSYKSEYVALYSILKEHNNSPNKEPNRILMLPNILRRFVELYTVMKYPSVKEVDGRLEKVFPDADNVLHLIKFMHWFSHLNQFEKVQHYDDKIFQIDIAIKELLDYIKKHDRLHWDGLQESMPDYLRD